MSENLLEVIGLKKYYPIHKGFFNKVQGAVKAVDDISFSVNKGETFGLVGKAAAANRQPGVRCCG